MIANVKYSETEKKKRIVKHKKNKFLASGSHAKENKGFHRKYRNTKKGVSSILRRNQQYSIDGEINQCVDVREKTELVHIILKTKNAHNIWSWKTGSIVVTQILRPKKPRELMVSALV